MCSGCPSYDRLRHREDDEDGEGENGNCVETQEKVVKHAPPNARQTCH